jgi:hypothetical protein
MSCVARHVQRRLLHKAKAKYRYLSVISIYIHPSPCAAPSSAQGEANINKYSKTNIANINKYSKTNIANINKYSKTNIANINKYSKTNTAKQT